MLKSLPNFRTFLVASVLSSLVAHSAFAQVPRPSTAEPGRTERLRSVQPKPALNNKPLINSNQANRAATPLNNTTKFTLNEIKVENATAFSQAELAAEYSDYLGKKVTISTLNEIANRITARYRNAGYVLSRAVVAPQRINKGKVVIRVVEGSVDQVIFQGNRAPSNLLDSYAAKIQQNTPLSTALLERYLLLMEDLPGVSARATLQPSATQSGKSNVVVSLDEKPVNVGVTADNRGTRFLGQGQGSITVALNNLFGGLYEKTQLRFLNTSDLSELHYGELRHEQQLDSEGTKLALSGSYTRSEAGYTLKNFDVIGRDILLSAEVTHPYIRSRETNLIGSVQFDHRNTQLESLRVDQYEDVLNVARIGGSYDFVDKFLGVNRIDAKLSKGLGWSDNSSVAGGSRSRQGGQTNFAKINVEASHLRPLTGPFGLLLSGNAQLSNRALLSSEQFGIGGANYGSAYDSSEITGDSGIAGRTELQYTRQDDIEYVPTYQLYGFYDIGEVWVRRPTAGQKDNVSLASVGLGTRFNTNTPLTGGIELAIPLTKEVAANRGDGSAPRVFFNLSYQY